MIIIFIIIIIYNNIINIRLYKHLNEGIYNHFVYMHNGSGQCTAWGPGGFAKPW